MTSDVEYRSLAMEAIRGRLDRLMTSCMEEVTDRSIVYVTEDGRRVTIEVRVRSETI